LFYTPTLFRMKTTVFDIDSSIVRVQDNEKIPQLQEPNFDSNKTYEHVRSNM